MATKLIEFEETIKLLEKIVCVCNVKTVPFDPLELLWQHAREARKPDIKATGEADGTPRSRGSRLAAGGSDFPHQFRFE